MAIRNWYSIRLKNIYLGANAQIEIGPKTKTERIHYGGLSKDISKKTIRGYEKEIKTIMALVGVLIYCLHQVIFWAYRRHWCFFYCGRVVICIDYAYIYHINFEVISESSKNPLSLNEKIGLGIFLFLACWINGSFHYIKRVHNANHKQNYLQGHIIWTLGR